MVLVKLPGNIKWATLRGEKPGSEVRKYRSEMPLQQGILFDFEIRGKWG